MRSRNIAFSLHRWLGFIFGLILVVVGITGSLLVFQEEIGDRLNSVQFGPIVPARELVSPDIVLENARAARPDWRAINVTLPIDPTRPYKLRMTTPNANPDVYLDGYREVFVHPYTGVILGDRAEGSSFYRFLLNLHYRLFAEDTGVIVVGIVGILTLVLSLTGIILWPGWRDLVNGFKIKWNARPQRLNFDLHKVIGIVTVIFIAITAFTGACWNFYDFSRSIIYSLTATTSRPAPVSTPLAGRKSLALSDIIAKADTALPEGKTTMVYLPEEPEEVFTVFKKVRNGLSFGNTVYLDRFSGDILRLDREGQGALGDRIFHSFYALHFGTFWGLPSRILYVLVGLAPAALLLTGLVMARYRRRKAARSSSLPS